MSRSQFTWRQRIRGRRASLAGGCQLVLFFLLIAGRALALDITTADGKSFRQCEIETVEPDALRILHADGAARIPYEKLPASLQKQYFDPAKIAAYRQEAAEAQKAAASRVAELKRQQEEAAAREAQLQQEQAEENQREADRQEAQTRTTEELREAARRHKRTVMFILAGLALAVGLFLYFLPAIIARRKTNALAIFVFNLFFGWTGIGWVIALVWACTRDSAMDLLARQHLETPRAPERVRDGLFQNEERLQPGNPSPEGGRLRDGGRFIE
jgi:hypothetical protein